MTLNLIHIVFIVRVGSIHAMPIIYPVFIRTEAQIPLRAGIYLVNYNSLMTFTFPLHAIYLTDMELFVRIIRYTKYNPFYCLNT